MATQTAELKYLRMAPRKVRLVADTLKGLPVSDAEAQLMLQPRRAAKPLLKLLRSATANATHNQKLDAGKLVVKSIRVDQGPMLKRILPRARGSASPIQKKMSHIFMVLEESPKATKRFTIVVPKKVKGGVGGRTRRAPRDEKRDELATRPADEKKGVFKRLFQRKSV